VHYASVAVGPHGLDLFGRFNQRLDARRGVALVSVLHGHADDRAGLEIDGMRTAVFHLGDLRVGVVRMGPVVVEQLALCGQRIAAALKQGFDGCEAVTFSLADGVAAGQDVPHTHLHVVPRRTGDGLGWRAAGQLQDRETLDAIASQLRTALGVSLRVT
jgi:hypothetical protein